MGKDLLYKIAITKIPGIGVKLGKQLIAYCGGVEEVFKESKRRLSKIPNIGEKTLHAIFSANPEKLAAADLQYIVDNDISTTFYLDKEYPRRLKHFEDAPLLLYFKGKPDWNKERTIGIVGTRTPSEYGKQLCKGLIHELKEFDTQVISGLAYGIDAIAHRESCLNQIQNLAIMGTGIDKIYPPHHKKLSSEIEKDGALVTEYGLGIKADRENFPLRNRIIAMLSDAIVIVESKNRGGSLITAEFANSYNKDVFAFPGRTDDPYSEGCNNLIKQHKAALLQSAKDIGYIMRWEKHPNSITHQTELFPELDSIERSILDIMDRGKDVSIDNLHAQLSLSTGTLASTLLNLEFKGVVSSLPGKRYIRN